MCGDLLWIADVDCGDQDQQGLLAFHALEGIENLNSAFVVDLLRHFLAAFPTSPGGKVDNIGSLEDFREVSHGSVCQGQNERDRRELFDVVFLCWIPDDRRDRVVWGEQLGEP